MLNHAANFLAFQVGWWACVLGAAHRAPWLGPLVVLVLLAVHLRPDPAPKTASRIVLSVGLLGFVIDSTLGYAGILRFQDSVIATWLCPLWLMAIWMIFATTLRHSLGWLAGRYAMAALLGAVFGPISYYAGQSLGAVRLGGNVSVALGVLAALWALLMPGLVWWAAVQTGKGQ
jgi:hypothetical protein